MIDTLNDDLKQWIKTNARTLFPELFDDDNAMDKTDLLITQAWIYNKPYLYQVDDDTLKQLLLFYTGHLLSVTEQNNGDPTSVRINDLSVSFSNTSNDNDPYITQYNDLVGSLDLNDWDIEF